MPAGLLLNGQQAGLTVVWWREGRGGGLKAAAAGSVLELICAIESLSLFLWR